MERGSLGQRRARADRQPGVLLQHGRHVYEISYRTRYQLGFFDDHDELYWNVNGNGWTFAMDSVSAHFGCRAQSPPRSCRPRLTPAHSRQGRRVYGRGARRWRGVSHHAGVGAARGLTIVFSFPKASSRRRPVAAAGRWLHDNRGEVAGVAGVLLLLGFFSGAGGWSGAIRARDRCSRATRRLRGSDGRRTLSG